MSDYRRWFVAGRTYFFTVVTYNRYPLFRDPHARELLGNAIRNVLVEHPFQLFAMVLLWDHLHCLWILPPGDEAYPARWKAIKDEFTTAWLAAGGHEEPVTSSQRARGHRGICSDAIMSTSSATIPIWRRGSTTFISIRSNTDM